MSLLAESTDPTTTRGMLAEICRNILEPSLWYQPLPNCVRLVGEKMFLLGYQPMNPPAVTIRWAMDQFNNGAFIDLSPAPSYKEMLDYLKEKYHR